MSHLHLEWLLPGYLACVLHEVAHAYVAEWSGDWTPRVYGRVTMNPLKHMEWVGSVLVPLGMMWSTGFPLGWAKPVPINFMVLTGLQRIRVALAGPFCNLLQAGAWGAPLVVSALLWPDHDRGTWWEHLCACGVLVNALLALINLLPLLPLDGGRVVHTLLPPRWAQAMARYEWAQAVAVAGLLGCAAYLWQRR